MAQMDKPEIILEKFGQQMSLPDDPIEYLIQKSPESTSSIEDLRSLVQAQVSNFGDLIKIMINEDQKALLNNKAKSYRSMFLALTHLKNGARSAINLHPEILERLDGNSTFNDMTLEDIVVHFNSKHFASFRIGPVSAISLTNLFLAYKLDPVELIKNIEEMVILHPIQVAELKLFRISGLNLDEQ